MTKDEALKRIAAYPFSRAEELSVEQMREIAREALQSNEQVEPVAYGTWDTMLGKGNRMMYVRLDKGQDGCTVPLYTTPPQRKPLTEQFIMDSTRELSTDVRWPSTFIDIWRLCEAAHGIIKE